MGDQASVSLLRWLRRQLREPTPWREHLEAAVANDDPVEARRLLAVYHGRLRSNLTFALRPLVGERSAAVAEGRGALIDGVYLRQALARGVPDRAGATALVLGHLAREIEG